MIRHLSTATLVALVLLAAAPATGNPLPTQTLDLSVQNVQNTANLSFHANGSIYRSDFRTWSLVDGANLTVDLSLSQPINVTLELTTAAALVNGRANNPVTLKVNGNTIVGGFADTNATYHQVTWYLPSYYLKSGSNQLVLSLDSGATTQYFVRSVTAENFVGSTPPTALPPDTGLEQASLFAWHQFVALNWPAECTGPDDQNCHRDTPDLSKSFGDTSVPTVWQTYRHKTEVYVGSGNTPFGCTRSGSGCTGGYSTVPPHYIYTEQSTVKPCDGQPAVSAPSFMNLDETSQIGLNEMFAGVVDPSQPVNAEDHLIRFLAKTNKMAYDYVTPPGYYGQSRTAITNEANKITQIQINAGNQNKPGQPVQVHSDPQSIRFPAGTYEVKTGWRQLGSSESAGDFLTSNVRYYHEGSDGEACYVESKDQNETWGMAALHIISKTSSVNNFTFATFGQIDNIRAADGSPAETPAGQPKTSANATNPKITSTAANVSGGTFHKQVLSPDTADCSPGKQLYYGNNEKHETTQGPVCFQNRFDAIPATVQKVNSAVQAQLAGLAGPFDKYRLVNIQWQPFGYGQISGSDEDHSRAVYYLANEVVETNYNLQNFRGGQIPKATGLISDYGDGTTSLGLNPYSNTFVYEGGGNWTAYNMGGCMGCHGVAQLSGGDFSFILAFAGTKEPEYFEPGYSIHLGMEQRNPASD